jgi:hypothetical protein
MPTLDLDGRRIVASAVRFVPVVITDADGREIARFKISMSFSLSGMV